MSDTKFPFLVTAIGVGLMAISEVYSFVRVMMFRSTFRAGGGPGQGFAGRQFGGGFGFGLAGVVTTVGLIIAIVGVVWLGIALRKPKST